MVTHIHAYTHISAQTGTFKHDSDTHIQEIHFDRETSARIKGWGKILEYQRAGDEVREAGREAGRDVTPAMSD